MCVLVCAWYGVAHILQVKGVVAIRGKRCQHLDSVAMEGLQHSWRRTQGKSARGFNMWHEDEVDSLSR